MSNYIRKQDAIEAVGLNTWAGSKISQLPTVEAIPYEFLRKLAKNQPHFILTVWDFLPRVIENIIKIWEKENDSDDK